MQHLEVSGAVRHIYIYICRLAAKGNQKAVSVNPNVSSPKALTGF